ncbi:unnamed protein product [Darwinula stevensoni]|uniref:Cleft lip and palate associated transmembrane protein n=1 Tax=Darwinula stevensoni TaxID=69355 RepID=A0A7R8WZJ3_9CRUS|nr:unnamed protein product [Darwinula stevensoni]CAG0880629.1 unnamed protein product [Darwinula stevensoni]
MSNTGGQDVAPAPAAAPAADGNAEQQQQGFTFSGVVKGLLIRAVFIYFITSFFRRPQPQQVTPDGNAPKPAVNIFSNGTAMDMYVFLSENIDFEDFNNSQALLWLQEDLVYGDWTGGPSGDGTFTRSFQIEASMNVQNNGSLFLHLFIVPSGQSPDPKQSSLYSHKMTIKQTHQLNKFKKRRFRKTQNLLTGETAASPEEVKKAEESTVEIISHWHPNLTVNIVNDYTAWTMGAVPPPLDEYVEFTSGGAHYKPIVFFNTYWNLLREYQPINETAKILELHLTYQPISLFKWQMYSAQNMRSRWTSGFLGDSLAEEEDEDQDSLKEALLETSPYLLGLTFAISILHTIFEFLAFKNDIQFWKNKQSLEGLSVRSVFFNVFQALIVVLYVLDNETNTIVRISTGIGLLIEIWKIHKVVDIKMNQENRIFGIFPKISFQDKGSYVESSTKRFDEMAFKYLSWALFPLLACYSIYSLLYLEHKGWYSFVLSMLYGFLLTFGFIMMTPQLFINYKMKSVAHLPWRMLTYKFLNTFIDDIFAFVIKMPTMYRIGCFRDDIVFFIFLYQRYIYRVDPSRVNEFGFSKEELEKAAQGGQTPAIEAEGNTAAAANGEVPSAAKSSKDKKED